MATLPNMLNDVEFARTPDWRKLQEEPDPEETENGENYPTPPDVAAILGFDPDELEAPIHNQRVRCRKCGWESPDDENAGGWASGQNGNLDNDRCPGCGSDDLTLG